MKQIKILLLSGLVTLLFTGCGGQLNMPLSYAKVSRGYLNSSNHSLGKVYLWDTQTKKRQSIKLLKSDLPDNNATKTSIGKRYEKKIANIDQNTKIDATGTFIPEDIYVDAKAEFVKATNVLIKDYQLKEFDDPRYLMNSKHLRRWRESLVTDGYLDNNRYKFILISEIVEGKQALITLDNNASVSAESNVIKVGSYNFKTTYNRKQREEIKGKEDVPLIVVVTVFDFKSDPEQKKYKGYRFSISDDIENIFDYQSM